MVQCLINVKKAPPYFGEAWVIIVKKGEVLNGLVFKSSQTFSEWTHRFLPLGLKPNSDGLYGFFNFTLKKKKLDE
jgi:hypothetical protein